MVLSGLAETIRERIDQLRYDQQHDARGARIILGDVVAQSYETHQFAPAWQEPARLDALVATLMDVATDGLDPADYHLEALRSYRLDLRMRTPMTAVDRADLELIATDALVLALYHVYGGKVDPLKLSSQWNYSTRPPRHAERAYSVSRANPGDGPIREALDEVRPQHVWYQRGRERLQEYRAIAAAGGWPELPDGPSLKPGMSDARVPVLRRRLEVTKDLPTLTAAKAPAATGMTAPAGAAGPAAGFDPSLVYDATLVTGVQHFQERHGLTADGVDRSRHARRDQRAGAGPHRPDPRQPGTLALDAARGQGRVRAGRCRRLRRLVLPQRQTDLDVARRGGTRFTRDTDLPLR